MRQHFLQNILTNKALSHIPSMAASVHQDEGVETLTQLVVVYCVLVVCFTAQHSPWSIQSKLRVFNP